MEEKVDDEEDEEDANKFKTIVAKQVVQVLRLSHKDIAKFVSKVNEGKNFTQEDLDKAQSDTVAAFYLSTLLSDESNLKNKKAK